MIDTLTSTPFFGLGVTLLCWYLAVRFQKRTGLLICNPVLVASLLVIGIMLLFHIPLDNYNAGGSIVKLLLAPATAVLALNIYQQRAILKRHFWPVVLGCFVGSLVSMLLVQVLCRLFQAEASLLNSLLPKSVTTAIACLLYTSLGCAAQNAHRDPFGIGPCVWPEVFQHVVRSSSKFSMTRYKSSRRASVSSSRSPLTMTASAS